ncbi:hypothetical protein B9J78_03930 [bacterium Unc6]|nr:hypothetical protein [bacterium Unc6]
MRIIDAVFLGVIQGLTEFLPISSSGHLVVVQQMFNLRQAGFALNVLLHLGTIFSILIFFYKDIIALFNKNRKTIYMIFISMLPTGVLGLFLHGYLENLFENIRFVGWMWLINGMVLISASLYLKFKKSRTFKNSVGFKEAVWIGFSQGVAVLPGISRSGSTISCAIFSGIEKQQAIRFSMLLSIPAVVAANIVKINDIQQITDQAGLLPVFLGFITSFLSGILALWILWKAVQKQKFEWFGIYCIIAGTYILI